MLSMFGQAWSSDVIIFLPQANTDEVKEAVKKDAVLSKLNVIIPERQRDFEQALKNPSDAIIASSIHTGRIPHYQPRLRCLNAKGEDAETWVIISIDPKATAASAAQGGLALVDELGKKGTDEWLLSALNGKISFPKIRRGKDVGDIFKMLGLEIAQFCLVDNASKERMAKEFKGTITTIISTDPIKCSRIFFKEGASADLVNPWKGLSKDFLKAIGASSLAECESGEKP